MIDDLLTEHSDERQGQGVGLAQRIIPDRSLEVGRLDMRCPAGDVELVVAVGERE